MINELKKIKSIWNKLIYILTPQQKRYGVLLFMMSLVGALFETLGVSIIIPMVQAMLSPELLWNNQKIAFILFAFHFTHKSDIVWPICILVICVYLLKNVYLTVLSWVRARYSCKVMRELSTKVMRSYMGRNYSFFLNTSIGDLIRGTSGDANGVYNIIYQGYRIIAESLTALLICIYIFIEDPRMAIVIICVGLFCILLIFGIFRNMMSTLGKKNRECVSLLSKYMLQAYEGIKEVMVVHRQNYFIEKYESTYLEQQKATTGSTLAAESPAYIIEAICISGIIVAVGFRVDGMQNATSFMPELASFAMAAFRILPSLGKISNAFNSLIFNIPTLDATYENIREVDLQNINRKKVAGFDSKTERVNFEKNVLIQNITWRYKDAEEPVLDGLCLNINKGESVGIIGASGAGKTTLMDIILGLLKPQSGGVIIDGTDIGTMSEQWSKMVGYVPQTVYLTDDTIRNNVAFGISAETISDDIIWKTLEKAQLAGFVRGLPQGLDTVVGDRGVRFSGGQRQRVAIARALYSNPEILIFDEATSALDNETENAVMESIEALHGFKTMIIVAHRLSTIEKCDKVYVIEEGKAKLR